MLLTAFLMALAATAIVADSVARLASDYPELSKFVDLLDATGQDVFLDDEEGPFTVFAPSNIAWEKSHLKSATIHQLRNIIAYHVVPTKLMAGDIQDHSFAKSLAGPKIYFDFHEGKLLINHNVEVEKVDLQGDNGVIHIIDHVLPYPKHDSAYSDYTSDSDSDSETDDDDLDDLEDSRNQVIRIHEKVGVQDEDEDTDADSESEEEEDEDSDSSSDRKRSVGAPVFKRFTGKHHSSDHSHTSSSIKADGGYVDVYEYPLAKSSSSSSSWKWSRAWANGKK